MVSDNGSNFVAADREIRELVAELDQEQIRRTTANKGVEWYWNPPATMEANSRAHSSRMATLVERISAIHWFSTQVVL